MKRLVSASILGIALLQSVPSYAGPNVNAKIVPHILLTTTKNQCSRPEARPSCSGVVSRGGLYPTLYFAYILVMDGYGPSGIRGLQFGIDYDGAVGSGIDVYGWALCATLEFASVGWPAANTGNLITWNNCQIFEPGGAGTGVTAVAGYLYMAAYSADVLKIRARPVDGLAKVADCSAIEDILVAGTPPNSALGEAAFSAGAVTPGFNPCGLELGVSCLISGPSSIVSGTTGNVFSVSSSPPGAAFNWSITGNGSIVGSTTGSSVSVTAGATGSLALRVDVTNGGQTNFCTMNVTVSPAPPMATCSITGPAPVLTGSSGHVYTVTSPNISPAFTWSISGDGLIVGSTTGSSVTVNAGSVGAFMLDVSVTANGNTGHCSKLVNVDPLSCGINGPDPVYNLATVTYSSPAPAGTTFLWSVTGNATINGAANGSSVLVNTGGIGSFTLHLDVSSSTGSQGCDKTVTVVLRPGPGPGANANARIALHVMSITSKNACGARALVPCQSIVTHGSLYPSLYYTYILVTDGYAPAGITGVQLGITYNGTEGSGIDVFGWALCATNEQRSTGWPSSGGGNLLTWSTCQNTEPGGAGTGVVAVGGYFYMGAYNTDFMRTTKRPSDDVAAVLDCNGLSSTIADRLPSPFGWAAFGNNVFGYNPCGGIALPVQPTTWSAIKALYPR